jgi:RHS repeat-associated protein
VDDVTQNGSEVQKLTWGYDAAGNRLSSTVLGGEHVSYTYGGGNELLSKNDGTTTTTSSYDGNGNLLGSSPTGASSTYNPKNQTTKIGSDSFTYSGAGQKDLVQINADTAVYTGLGLSAYTDGGTTSHYVRCSCGLLNDERTPDGKKYYYLFDGLGSIVGMTDSTGSEVNRYDYDPYGVMLHQQEQSGFTNLFKFAGGQYRSSTGLYKFGQRYYNPNLGRWTQLDPAGTGYVYAGDNPVNAVDPSGKFRIRPIIGGFIGPFPIPVGIIALLSQAEAQEVASGSGLAVVIAILGLLPPPLEFPAAEIFIGVTIWEAKCGSLGVNVYLYFNGAVDFSCSD